MIKKCKRCGRLCQKEFCKYHRHLSENFKASRRKEMWKLRQKPEYREKQRIYAREWRKRKLLLKNSNKVLNSLSSKE